MSTTTEIFDVPASIAAQKELQQAKNYPDFAPIDGHCYGCRRQIYVQQDSGHGYKTGISLEKASTELITGCPHCHYSYCE